MFLLFVLLLLIILFGILIGIYSVFFPFMQNVGTVSQYISAYYGALAGIERAELSLKYRAPGFQWSWGYAGNLRYGPVSDFLTGNMDMLTLGNNGFGRSISSRTLAIPRWGEGDVDYLLAASDSANYNMLDYFRGTKIFLSKDTTTNTLFYYSSGGNLVFFTWGFFTWELRLPPKVLGVFWWYWWGGQLCFDADVSSCDPDGDGLFDDPVVNWFFDGNFSGLPFTIVPTVWVYDYSGKMIDTLVDIAFRKSLLKPKFSLWFGNTTPGMQYSPLPIYKQISGHTVISSDPSVLQTMTYNGIFSDDFLVTGLQLSLGLINLLRSFNDAVYPFLEYRFVFPQEIADTHFLIKWHSHVWEYDVIIYLKKPTFESSAFWDFTVVF